MRTASLVGVLLCVAGSASAADGYTFLGPLPARNFQPIQLIFLNLPFERARTVGDGRVAVQVSSAESNEIATTQGSIQSVLKFETNRTALGVRYGVATHWDLAVEIPFISRFGGFLDPFIDEVEGVFNAGNVERDTFPNNSFGGFQVRRDGSDLFYGRRQHLELGDLSLSAKREFELGEALPVLAARAAVKLPTGRAGGVFGSGKPDVGIGLAVEQQVLPRLMAYLNLDLVYPIGSVTPARLTLNPILSESFAAEFALTPGLSALLHQAVYTSPLHGTGVRLLDGTPVEIGVGFNYACSPSLGFQVLAIDNVSPVEPAADFSLMLSAALRL